MNPTDRQQDLRKRISALESQRAKVVDETKALVTRRDGHAGDIEKLKQRHAEACRAEALGQPNERERLERDISLLTAKLTGTETLIREKEADRQRVLDEMAGYEQQLRELVAIDTQERQLREVTGMNEATKREFFQEKELGVARSKRVLKLRSPEYQGPDVSPVVRAAAGSTAEKIANAAGGLRMHEWLTPAELKRLRDMGAIS